MPATTPTETKLSVWATEASRTCPTRILRSWPPIRSGASAPGDAIASSATARSTSSRRGSTRNGLLTNPRSRPRSVRDPAPLRIPATKDSANRRFADHKMKAGNNRRSITESEAVSKHRLTERSCLTPVAESKCGEGEPPLALRRRGQRVALASGQLGRLPVSRLQVLKTGAAGLSIARRAGAEQAKITPAPPAGVRPFLGCPTGRAPHGARVGRVGGGQTHSGSSR